MKAQDFLRKGADLLEERGKQYDQPDGERSMGKAVRAFNTITGRSLYESEGWLLLQILKDVRQWQNPDKYHADSAEDCVSYAALKAEALASGMDEYIDKFDDFGAPLPLEASEEFEVVEISHPSLGTLTYLDGELVHTEEPAASIDDDSARMQAIGQNGNTGEHYDDAPSWSEAPDIAMWLSQDADGRWFWFEGKPEENEYEEWFHAGWHTVAKYSEPSKYWRDTLQARPTKEAI